MNDFVNKIKDKSILESPIFFIKKANNLKEEVKELIEFAKGEVQKITDVEVFTDYQYKKLSYIYDSFGFIYDSIDFSMGHMKEKKEEKEILDECLVDMWAFVVNEIHENTKLKNKFMIWGKGATGDNAIIVNYWLENRFDKKKSPKKEKMMKINNVITSVSEKINQNINDFIVNPKHAFIVNEDEGMLLTDLPKTTLRQAKEYANNIGKNGAFAFRPSEVGLWPILRHVGDRNLRKKAYSHYMKANAFHKKYDNQALFKKLLNKKQELAQMANDKNYFEFISKKHLIKDAEDIQYFIDKTMSDLSVVYQQAIIEMKEVAKENGIRVIKPWDFHYFMEKVSEKSASKFDEKYKINVDFAIEQMMKLLAKEFNMEVQKITDRNICPDDMFYIKMKDNVTDKEGFILFDIFFNHKSKSGLSYNCCQVKNMAQYFGKNSASVAVITGALVSKKTRVMSLQNVIDLHHEVGHALHGFYSQFKDSVFNEVNISQDLIEVPSQMMEQHFLNPNFAVKFLVNCGCKYDECFKDVKEWINSTLVYGKILTQYKNLTVDKDKFELFVNYKAGTRKKVHEFMSKETQEQFNIYQDFFMGYDSQGEMDYGPTPYVYLLNDIIAWQAYSDLYLTGKMTYRDIYVNILSKKTTTKMHKEIMKNIKFNKYKDAIDYFTRSVDVVN